MHDIESSTFGISQDTFDMLPAPEVVMGCRYLWPFCW